MDIFNLNQDLLVDFVSKKWIDNRCTMCGINKWIVSDKFFKLDEIEDGGGNVFPICLITCENCGNTIMINPLVLDID